MSSYSYIAMPVEVSTDTEWTVNIREDFMQHRNASCAYARRAETASFVLITVLAAGALSSSARSEQSAHLFEPFADVEVRPMACSSSPGYGRSRESLLPEAHKGSVNSMLLLAASYRTEAPLDERSARFWYSQALATGDSLAYEAAAQLHFCGWLYLRDYGEAVRLLEEGARTKDGVRAARELGNLYELGVGVPVDASRAFMWYSRSDSIDYARALYHGIGTEKSPAAAFAWLKRKNDEAEAKGYAWAVAHVRYNLALMYWRGLGVPRSEARARMLLKQALESNFGLSAATRKKAEALLRVGNQPPL